MFETRLHGCERVVPEDARRYLSRRLIMFGIINSTGGVGSCVTYFGFPTWLGCRSHP